MVGGESSNRAVAARSPRGGAVEILPRRSQAATDLPRRLAAEAVENRFRSPDILNTFPHRKRPGRGGAVRFPACQDQILRTRSSWPPLNGSRINVLGVDLRATHCVKPPEWCAVRLPAASIRAVSGLPPRVSRATLSSARPDAITPAGAKAKKAWLQQPPIQFRDLLSPFESGIGVIPRSARSGD